MCACYSELCRYLHVALWSSSCINSAHLYCSEFALEIASEFAPVFLSLFQPELNISPVFALVLSSLAVLKNIDGMLPCSMFFFVWFSNRDFGPRVCLVGRNFLLAERIFRLAGWSLVLAG